MADRLTLSPTDKARLREIVGRVRGSGGPGCCPGPPTPNVGECEPVQADDDGVSRHTLVVVARGRSGLQSYLRGCFSSMARAASVILDRRYGERRQCISWPGVERRRRSRRRLDAADDMLGRNGYVIIGSSRDAWST